MTDFRKISPNRRKSVPTVSKHNEYKLLLREDFHQRCGYCGDHDFFRDTYYEVDHFVPKKYLVNISSTEYSNLVYSCRSCNNFKRAKWPTKDENKHNDGKQGFIDPCDSAYAEQFERIKDGSIYPITELGYWIWSAINLGNPIHRLKWKLEQLRIFLDELKDIFNNEPPSIEEYTIFLKIYSMYSDLEKQLKGKPNFN